MWDHIGEDAIFAGAQAVPMAASDDVVDLTVHPDERQSVLAATAWRHRDQRKRTSSIFATWRKRSRSRVPDSSRFEADNLDLGDYDDVCGYLEEELRGKR